VYENFKSRYASNGSGSAHSDGAARQAQQLFEEARQREQQGDFKGAERLYQQYLQRFPQSGEAFANLGVIYAKQARFTEAIQAYQRALKIDPALHAVYLNLGIAYFKTDKFKAAIPPIRKFLSVEPENQQARQLLGLAYVQEDRFSDAIEMLSPFRERGDPSVLLALGACYVKTGRMQEAQDALTRLLTAEGDSPRIHFLLGETYLGLNQYPQALQEFRTVYALDPHWPQIHFLLGAVQARLGDFAQAERELRTELREYPDEFGANFVLGALLSKQSRLDDAIRCLERARGQNPGHSDTLYELARAQYKKGLGKEALLNVHAALQADRKNRAAHYLLGQMARASGDNETARREFAIAQSLSVAESEHDILRLTQLNQGAKK
jgi:tetratricopeptide (TPR) repeat protein